MPKAVKDWSLRSLQVKLIKMGSWIVCQARQIIFQLAEEALSRVLPLSWGARPGYVWLRAGGERRK